MMGSTSGARLLRLPQMKSILLIILSAFAACAACGGQAAASAERTAKQLHGELGERSARFLLEHMPEPDRSALSADFLLEHIALALRAREEFP
jgi:hypothetical protein